MDGQRRLSKEVAWKQRSRQIAGEDRGVTGTGGRFGVRKKSRVWGGGIKE